MICPKCGKEVSDLDAVCPYCGETLKKEEETQNQSKFIETGNNVSGIDENFRETPKYKAMFIACLVLSIVATVSSVLALVGILLIRYSPLETSVKDALFIPTIVVAVVGEVIAWVDIRLFSILFRVHKPKNFVEQLPRILGLIGTLCSFAVLIIIVYSMFL